MLLTYSWKDFGIHSLAGGLQFNFLSVYESTGPHQTCPRGVPSSHNVKYQRTRTRLEHATLHTTGEALLEAADGTELEGGCVVSGYLPHLAESCLHF